MSEITEQLWRPGLARLAELFKTDLSAGLSSAEAAARLERHGPNQLQEKGGEGPWRLFLAQFKSVMIWVLVAAAVVSGILREWVDTAAILAIVILNAVLGFVQEYRAEKSLAALRKLSSPNSKAIRDGLPCVVPSAGLAPGDLVELEAGDHVPADCRVVTHTSSFGAQEASLTGESQPVSKNAEPIDMDSVQLGDRANMLFMGTSIVSGRCRALVVKTGMSTVLGGIAGMIQDIKSEPTPLQKNIDRFGKVIVKLCFALVGLVFLIQLVHGSAALAEIFLSSVSLAVAAIPEGLPAVVTVALALGVQRMVRRNALIRKLPSVETLGCASVICSDKTGTLTRNEMTVRAVYAGGQMFDVGGIGYEPAGEFSLGGARVAPGSHPELMAALEAGALCNGARLVRTPDAPARMAGDPTEGALLVCAGKAGLWKETLEEERPFVEEIPFDSARKMMSVVRRGPGGRLVAYVKGAPDILLSRCAHISENGLRRPMLDEDRREANRQNTDLAGRAMRVLAVAWRELDGAPEKYLPETVEKDLTFGGLLAMIDPPREEVKVAMAKCRTAGIRTVRITGDHKSTAVAIARELGMAGGETLALSGEELDRMDGAALDGEVDRIGVYARVSPEHKLRIVRAWRKRGHVVAMTGDGVNDAPAVKEADIGVAMGITGTDVTKEVSDMVVTDDNFASIVSAVEEGRGIYGNIVKFIHYLLSCNAGEIFVMFIASLFNMPLPLLPIHILWVNLVTDGLPALALGVDPVDSRIMSKPPRKSSAPVVTVRRAAVIVGQGFFIALCSLLAFWYEYDGTPATLVRARTAAFMVLAVSQLFHAFNCRSSTMSLFKIGVFTNRPLLAAAFISLALQVMVEELPFLRTVFKVEALTWGEWGIVVLLSSMPFWIMELAKLIASRVPRFREAL